MMEHVVKLILEPILMVAKEGVHNNLGADFLNHWTKTLFQ